MFKKGWTEMKSLAIYYMEIGDTQTSLEMKRRKERNKTKTITPA